MANIETYTGARGTTYRVRWRHLDGGKDVETFRRKADAAAFRARIELDPDQTNPTLWGDAPTPPPSRPAGPTVADMYARLVAGLDVSESRAATIDSLYRIQLEPLHKTAVAALTDQDIQEWIGWASKRRRPDGRKAWSPATVSMALTVLRQILGAAVRAKVITANPARGEITPPKVRRPRVRPDQVVAPAELGRVLDAAPDRYRALFGLMLLAGPRLSECLGLTPEHLHLDAGRVTLGVQTTTDVAGRTAVKDGGKTDGAERSTKLPRVAVELLRDHLERYPTAPGQRIFRTESGAIPNRSNIMRRQWLPTLERAGIDRHVTVSKLRSSNISWRYRAGEAPLSVAAEVGHRRAAMSLDTYAAFIDTDDTGHKLDAFLDEAAAR